MWTHLREAGTVVFKGDVLPGPHFMGSNPHSTACQLCDLKYYFSVPQFFQCKMGTMIMPVSKDVRMK